MGEPQHVSNWMEQSSLYRELFIMNSILGKTTSNTSLNRVAGIVSREQLVNFMLEITASKSEQFSHHASCKVVQTKGWNVPSGGLQGINSVHSLSMLFVFCKTHMFY